MPQPAENAGWGTFLRVIVPEAKEIPGQAGNDEAGCGRAWWSGRFFKPERPREGLKGSDARREDRREKSFPIKPG